jgi:hypothetical protein
MRRSPRNLRIACNHAGLTHFGGIFFFHEFMRVLQFRAPLIDTSQNFLSPPDRIIDSSDRGRNPLSAVIVCELLCGKNCCHYPEHSLSTFFHGGHQDRGTSRKVA